MPSPSPPPPPPPQPSPPPAPPPPPEAWRLVLRQRIVGSDDYVMSGESWAENADVSPDNASVAKYLALDTLESYRDLTDTIGGVGTFAFKLVYPELATAEMPQPHNIWKQTNNPATEVCDGQIGHYTPMEINFPGCGFGGLRRACGYRYLLRSVEQWFFLGYTYQNIFQGPCNAVEESFYVMEVELYVRVPYLNVVAPSPPPPPPPAPHVPEVLPYRCVDLAGGYDHEPRDGLPGVGWSEEATWQDCEARCAALEKSHGCGQWQWLRNSCHLTHAHAKLVRAVNRNVYVHSYRCASPDEGAQIASPPPSEPSPPPAPEGSPSPPPIYTSCTDACRLGGLCSDGNVTLRIAQQALSVRCAFDGTRGTDTYLIEDGLETSKYTMPTSCPEGMHLWVPRTYRLLRKMLDFYGEVARHTGVYGVRDGCSDGCATTPLNSGEPTQASESEAAPHPLFFGHSRARERRRTPKSRLPFGSPHAFYRTPKSRLPFGSPHAFYRPHRHILPEFTTPPPDSPSSPLSPHLPPPTPLPPYAPSPPHPTQPHPTQPHPTPPHPPGELLDVGRSDDRRARSAMGAQSQPPLSRRWVPRRLLARVEYRQYSRHPRL